MSAAARPTYSGNIYGREALCDPRPHFTAIRDLGPAVWLARHRLWAIGRHEDVRTALRAADQLVSGEGVAANSLVNGRRDEITLTADGEVHARRRGILIRPLTPAALASLRARMQDEADALVLQLKGQDRFDAMTAFAACLPVSIVAELVGLRPEGRANMLKWAAATFNALGPLNWRMIRALPTLLDLGRYARRLTRDDVVPGGWADRLFAAAEDGLLSRREARAMIIDYVAPSLDTTILATGHMLWLLAETPELLDTLRGDESLISNAVLEAVRLSSPIRGFTRHVAEDFPLGGITIPKGERVLLLFASANRDERRYADPDRFDIARNARDHVAWGHGPHVCAGMHLARLEMECLLTALVRHAARIEVGTPEPLLNNVLQGFRALPARFH